MLNNLAFEATKPNRPYGKPYGVPVEWQPGNPEQVVKWYCFGSRTIHGIEGCEECADTRMLKRG